MYEIVDVWLVSKHTQRARTIHITMTKVTDKNIFSSRNVY